MLIYVHKERTLDAMRQRYPARHYVMVDDKTQLLAAMKRLLGQTLTTVFAHQGHYATQSAARSADMQLDPPPDLDLRDFRAASSVGAAATNQERT